jgi:hypothetical protein
MPCAVGGQDWQPAPLGIHLLQGRGRYWFVLGNPKPKCLGKGGDCFSEIRALFVCFLGVFPVFLRIVRG